MTIQREFVLRYRSKGHVRFQVPERICSATVSTIIENRVAAIAGVSKVRFFRTRRKLSIRFDETVCRFVDLAKQLFDLLVDLEQSGLLQRESERIIGSDSKWRTRVAGKLNSFKAGRWLKGKYSDAKETVQAAKVITKLGMKRPKAFVRDPEQAIINFLNDILVLYLIKIHWRRVTKEWIPNPFKYRYEWLAVWYLFFLLVRSRKPKK